MQVTTLLERYWPKETTKIIDLVEVFKESNEAIKQFDKIVQEVYLSVRLFAMHYFCSKIYPAWIFLLSIRVCTLQF